MLHRLLLILLLVRLPGASCAEPPASSGKDKIAFVQGGNIWTIRPDGKAKKQITFSGHDASPAWSRDGKMLAFIREWPEKYGRGDLYIIHADGTNECALVKGEERCVSPLWSSKADELAFIRYRDKSARPGSYIEFVDAAGKPTAPKFLYVESEHLHSSAALSLCDWSRDGKQISLIESGYLYLKTVVLERTAEGFNQKPPFPYTAVVEDEGVDRSYLSHGWSPVEPQKILMVRYLLDYKRKKYQSFLSIGREDTGLTQDLLAIPYKNQGLPFGVIAVWSPDGKQIAYESQGAIYIIDVEKPKPRLLVQGSSPRWSAK